MGWVHLNVTSHQREKPDLTDPSLHDFINCVRAQLSGQCTGEGCCRVFHLSTAIQYPRHKQVFRFFSFITPHSHTTTIAIHVRRNLRPALLPQCPHRVCGAAQGLELASTVAEFHGDFLEGVLCLDRIPEIR